MWPMVQRPYSEQTPVMAKVIEFYVPQNFRRASKPAVEMQSGKIIEFRLPAEKSA
jgi:hypothetical protein